MYPTVHCSVVYLFFKWGSCFVHFINYADMRYAVWGLSLSFSLCAWCVVLIFVVILLVVVLRVGVLGVLGFVFAP